jgi:hypothetical protein
MSGAVWATVAGVGFGLFQCLNRQAVRGLDAGLIHFSVGWTLLNASQKRIGAARTSPLLAATPLFGSVLAAVTLGEVPGIVTILGMLLIVGGVYVTVGTGEPAAARPDGRKAPGGLGPTRGLAAVSGRSATAGAMASAAGSTPTLSAGSRWRGSLFGLGTAACWAVSPLLIREGLAGVPSPGLGVTISMVAATIPQGVVVALRRRRGLGEPPVWTRWPTSWPPASWSGCRPGPAGRRWRWPPSRWCSRSACCRCRP